MKDASGFTVDVYEDDDWIDTVDVNESIASGEEKEIEITFSKSVSKEVQTYRFVIKMKIAIQKIMNRKLNSDMQMFR